MANQNVSSPDGKRLPGMRTENVGGTATKATMSRTLVWIEQQRFRGFGCSECVAGGSNPGAPFGTSFDE